MTRFPPLGFLPLAAAVALTALLASNANAATVTYQLDALFDQYFTDVTVVGPAQGSGPVQQYGRPDIAISRTIAIDTDLYPIAGNTITADTFSYNPVPGLGGSWADHPQNPPENIDLSMTFDLLGGVTDWSLVMTGRNYYMRLTDEDSYFSIGSSTALGPEAWDEALYGPRPVGEFFFFTVFDYRTSSAPGTWARIDPPAVPLPPSLLASGLGLIALASMRLFSRRRDRRSSHGKSQGAEAIYMYMQRP